MSTTKHPGYTYRLNPEATAEAVVALRDRKHALEVFFCEKQRWADEIAEELDLIGWAVGSRGIPVPFDPDEHENKGTDPERPHVLEIAAYERSYGKPYLGELKGLPAIHPDDYPGPGENWPHATERRSLVPEGWYRYAKDRQVKVHEGGRTKAAEEARDRRSTINVAGPEHVRDIVMRAATVPTNHFRYPGVTVGKGADGEDIILMNSNHALHVKDEEAEDAQNQPYREAREGDLLEPISLGAYEDLRREIDRQREAD